MPKREKLIRVPGSPGTGEWVRPTTPSEMRKRAEEWVKGLLDDPTVGLLHGHIWPEGLPDRLAAEFESIAEQARRPLAEALAWIAEEYKDEGSGMTAERALRRAAGEE